jgi:poly(3-hydroxyalkanoate) synthetase
VTLVDFTDTGDMAVFIDDEQLASLEKRMEERGYLEAHDMANSFNMLRANDLIWSFVVNNYLLGKEPVPFDLLYLELGLHAHAGRHALVLSAEHVSAEPVVEAGRH